MEQNQHQNLQTLSQVTKSQILKKITQLLLSVSLFSLLLANSSSLSFLHSFNFYLSTFPAQLFSHTINKNCIFLLCNGLLVFVAKYSGLISSSSKNNHSSIIESLIKNYEDSTPSLVLEPKMKVPENEVLVESTEAQEKLAGKEGRENECMIGQVDKDGETEKFIVADEEKGESGFLITGKEGEESEVFGEEDNQQEVKELENELPIQEQEEEEEEEEDDDDDEGIEVLSTEELNKKFDEFIRKMKEEIRIEARQQLVMVN